MKLSPMVSVKPYSVCGGHLICFKNLFITRMCTTWYLLSTSSWLEHMLHVYVTPFKRLWILIRQSIASLALSTQIRGRISLTLNWKDLMDGSPLNFSWGLLHYVPADSVLYLESSRDCQWSALLVKLSHPWGLWESERLKRITAVTQSLLFLPYLSCMALS